MHRDYRHLFQRVSYSSISPKFTRRSLLLLFQKKLCTIPRNDQKRYYLSTSVSSSNTLVNTNISNTTSATVSNNIAQRLNVKMNNNVYNQVKNGNEKIQNNYVHNNRNWQMQNSNSIKNNNYNNYQYANYNNNNNRSSNNLSSNTYEQRGNMNNSQRANNVSSLCNSDKQSDKSSSTTVNVELLLERLHYPHLILRYLISNNHFTEAATFFESHYNSSEKSFLEFCDYCICEVRDMIVLLMRLYANLGKMARVREIFAIALRDLQHETVTEEENENGNSNSLLESIEDGKETFSEIETFEPNLMEITSELEKQARALHHKKGEIINITKWEERNNKENNESNSIKDEVEEETSKTSSTIDSSNNNNNRSTTVRTKQLFNLLNINIFNTYLEILTLRKNYDVQEVLMVLKEMDHSHTVPNPLTYHYLIELHIRAGYDPHALWVEMVEEQHVKPLPTTVQTLLLRVLPFCTDAHFAVQIVQAGLYCGPRILDKKMIKEIMEKWLREKTSLRESNEPESSITLQEPTQLHSNNHNNNVKKKNEAEKDSSSVYTQSILSCTNNYPPSYVLWLVLELEVRCVLERASFTQYVDKHFLLELLVKCAKLADVHSAEGVMALMDRHAMSRTPEIMAMMVWCYSTSRQIENAIDELENMARRGFLDHMDSFTKYIVAPIHYVMERNFMSLLVEAIDSPAMLQRALTHLHYRQQTHQKQINISDTNNTTNIQEERSRRRNVVGASVSIHSLDLMVLAACKLGEERKALKLVASYYTQWQLHPRVNTYNSLLMGTLSQRGTLLHRLIYDTMIKSGVIPNAQTYRVLIRQAVLSNNIDAALYYLKEVTRQQSLRVEVEMMLPILERAAKAGDVEVVEQMSQFALDEDIGLDSMILERVMDWLTSAGQRVSVLKAHQPLHEALRSRSPIGRLRARSEVALVEKV